MAASPSDTKRKPQHEEATDAAKPPARAKRSGKRASPAGDAEPSEERITRSIRLTPLIDAKLRELAEARGLDLNAALAVAIAEDWWRYLTSKPPSR